MKFTKVGIRDPLVNDVEGAAMLIPAGWKLDGGFVWMFEYSMQANLIVRVSDPQTGAAVELLPSQQFNIPTRDMGGLPAQPGSNWKGSVYLPPPRHPAELVQSYYAPSLPHLQNARLVRADDLPQIAEQIKRSTPGAADKQLRLTRLRYQFDVAGQGWEEDVYLILTLTPDNGWQQMWWAGGYTMRAPAGMLDRLAPMLQASALSVRFSLDWTACLEHVRTIFRQGLWQELRDQQRLGEQLRQHREQLRQAYQQVWDERQAALDARNFAFRESLGGIETYRDPYESRNIELPVGYKDYWVNNKGEYLLSNDPSYNPSMGSTLEWKKMQRYQP
jgi:hypothetical protein